MNRIKLNSTSTLRRTGRGPRHPPGDGRDSPRHRSPGAFTRARAERQRARRDDVFIDDEDTLDDERQYQAAADRIAKRIAEVEQRVADLEARYGVNVLLN
jgi:hypothetical protein